MRSGSTRPAAPRSCGGRPTLATYTATRADLEATAREVFEVIRDGKVRVEIRHVYPLAEAAQVHRDLEGRRTVGSIVMVP